MKSKIVVLLLVLCVSGFGQTVRFAPDLSWNEQIHSWIGFSNPHVYPVEIAITGYDANGAVLGPLNLKLERQQRVEIAAVDLFAEGTPIWARVDSSDVVGNYLRFSRVDGRGSSLMPLSIGPGNDVWVARIAPDDVYSVDTLLVNSSEEVGGAVQNPIVHVGTTVTRHTETPTTIADFGAPRQQASISFQGSYKDYETPSWDRITASGGAQLLGLQHFRGETGLGTLCLPRTMSTSMNFPDLQFRNGGWSQIVLVNVYNSLLPVALDVYDEFGQQMETLQIYMKPYEKRVVDPRNGEIEGLPHNADRIRITPFENGLIGYHVYGNRKGALGVTAGTPAYSNGSVLPYTPSNSLWDTTIALINDSEDSFRVYLYGYTDEGKSFKPSKVIRVKPGEKLLYTKEDLFGDNANEVTWIRANTTKGELNAYAEVHKHDRSVVSLLPAMPYLAEDGESWRALFEPHGETNLLDQGWKPVVFSEPVRFPRIPRTNVYRYSEGYPAAGDFFSDNAYTPKCSYFHLGYRSIYQPYDGEYRSDGSPDSVAFMSPFFEVQDHGPAWLSWQMRLFNPQDATPGSRYGILWREEGSDQWHWNGVTGELWLNPPLSIGDCWTHDIQYLNELVVATGWLQFEFKLPDSTRGKRIQAGLYVHQVPRGTRGERTPWVFFDNMRLNIRPMQHAIDFGSYASGTFTAPEPDSLDGDIQE